MSITELRRHLSRIISHVEQRRTFVIIRRGRENTESTLRANS